MNLKTEVFLMFIVIFVAICVPSFYFQTKIDRIDKIVSSTVATTMQSNIDNAVNKAIVAATHTFYEKENYPEEKRINETNYNPIFGCKYYAGNVSVMQTITYKPGDVYTGCKYSIEYIRIETLNSKKYIITHFTSPMDREQWTFIFDKSNKIKEVYKWSMICAGVGGERQKIGDKQDTNLYDYWLFEKCMNLIELAKQNKKNEVQIIGD